MFGTDLPVLVFRSCRLDFWISADELPSPPDLTESSSSRARVHEAEGRALMRSAAGEWLLDNAVRLSSHPDAF